MSSSSAHHQTTTSSENTSGTHTTGVAQVPAPDQMTNPATGTSATAGSGATSTSNSNTSHSHIQQSAPVAKDPSTGDTSRVTTQGDIVSSSDPSTAPQASVAQKLKGDVAGAVSGTVGSLEAATGAMLRNKGMEQKGLDKMAEEDERLGAKRGVMPVGSGQRETTEDAK